jgi:hypothetical protein
MDKLSQLNTSLEEVASKIREISKSITFETLQEEEKQVEPLLIKVAELKVKIKKEVDNKYKDIVSSLKKEKDDLTKEINDIKIEQAKNSWYPEGTVVELWEYNGSSYDIKQKGVVCVYDGTQQYSGVNRYRIPQKGDIMVFFLKQDGTIGLKYDIVCRRNKESYFSLGRRGEWIKEGETPKKQ